jgi:hypothetical protein
MASMLACSPWRLRCVLRFVWRTEAGSEEGSNQERSEGVPAALHHRMHGCESYLSASASFLPPPLCFSVCLSVCLSLLLLCRFFFPLSLAGAKPLHETQRNATQSSRQQQTGTQQARGGTEGQRGRDTLAASALPYATVADHCELRAFLPCPHHPTQQKDTRLSGGEVHSQPSAPYTRWQRQQQQRMQKRQRQRRRR